MGKNPLTDHFMLKRENSKENDYFASRLANPPLRGAMPPPELQGRYRVPMPGDKLSVDGFRRRPELNGARAEVMARGVDAQGFVPVRIYLPPEDGVSGDDRFLKLRVNPNRLRPLGDSASASTLPMPNKQQVQPKDLPMGSMTLQTAAIKKELGKDGIPGRLRKQLRTVERDSLLIESQVASISDGWKENPRVTGNISMHSTMSSTGFAAAGAQQVYSKFSRRPPAPSTPVGLRSPVTHMPGYLPKQFQ